MQAQSCDVAASRWRTFLTRAPKILLRNVYGWFVRVERGLYNLSEGAKAALKCWKA